MSTYCPGQRSSATPQYLSIKRYIRTKDRLTAINDVNIQISVIFLGILVFFLLPLVKEGSIGMLCSVDGEVFHKAIHRVGFYVCSCVLQSLFPCGTGAFEVRKIRAMPMLDRRDQAGNRGQTYVSYSSLEASTAVKNSAIPSPVMLDTPTA